MEKNLCIYGVTSGAELLEYAFYDDKVTSSGKHLRIGTNGEKQ